MANLPTVGGSSGVWGSELNTWLLVAHNPDGTVKNSGAAPSGLSLPTVGGSSGVWGSQLNAWLLVAHNADGTLKGSSSPPSGLSLPTVGGSSGVWGSQLNAWLLVAHNADGTLKQTVPPPSVESTKAPILVYAYGSAVFTDTSKYPYVGVLVNSAHLHDNRNAWAAYWGNQNPRGKVVTYRTFLETSSVYYTTTPDWNSVVAQPVPPVNRRESNSGVVPAEEVKLHDNNNPNDRWMLYTASGGNFTFNGYPNSWVIDVGSLSYQALSRTYLRDICDVLGYDGIFSDNVVLGTGFAQSFPMYKRNSAGQLVVAYPSYVEYGNAVIAYLTAVCDPLRAEGYFMTGNVGVWIENGQQDTGQNTQSWWDRCGPHFDLMVSEYANVANHPNIGGWNNRSNDNVAWYDFLDGWTRDLHTVAKSKGSVACIGMGEATASDVFKFAIAVQRVEWDWTSKDYMISFFNGQFWGSFMQINWGTPAGARQVGANPKLRGRRWTGGWAVVNTSRTQSLSATWADPVAGGSRTFNLGPMQSYLGA